MSEFKFKLEQLQDHSVLQALRGVCGRLADDMEPRSTSGHEAGVSGAGGGRKAVKKCDSHLIPPLRSLLERASRVKDEQQRRAVVVYLAGFVGEHVWVLDVVYQDGGGLDGTELVLDAVFDEQGDGDAAASFRRLLRLIRRDRSSVDVRVRRLVVQRAAAALQRLPQSGASVLGRQWVPWALALAALPAIDSANAKDLAIGMEEVVESVVSTTCDAMVETPEVLVESLSGKEGGTTVETVLALVEVVMQIVLGMNLHAMGADEGACGGEQRMEEDQKKLAGLLTMRWELEWVARALGVCSAFRSYFSWSRHIRNRLLQMLLEDRDEPSEMADAFGQAVGLRCTPPQTLVALELLRASKSSRDASDVVFASCVGKVVRAGMQGLYRPKEVMAAERNQEFASLGQRIQVLISKNFHLDRLLRRIDPARGRTEDEMAGNGGDEEVDELLSLIGLGGSGGEDGSMAGASGRTPRSARRKIQPDRVGDVKVKEEEGLQDSGDGQATARLPNALSGLIHHNGRVIMPPTYNLDSESRELLWREYLKDKDKLVEMLGDSNYRKWHDESRRPELRRRSTVDSAFDAVFGAGVAINDGDNTITDQNGVLIDAPEKKALDLCCTVPWDALLVGALAIVTDIVRRLGAEESERAHLLDAVVDAYEVKFYVQEALDALPAEGRAAMESCMGDFSATAGLAGLICVSGTMRRILMLTTRHTRIELLGQYLELMQAVDAHCFRDLSERRRLRRPILLATTNLRACMHFPPLMANAISSKSAKILPELCALARDIESIVYTSACCWTVWHSLKSKRVPADWIPEGVDLSTHPLCAAGVQQRCHFISSSLHLVSAMVHEIDESDAADGGHGDIISALVSSSSLCATIAVDLRKGLTLYRSRTKTTKSAFQIVCQQTQVHLNVLSVASALCEIYCGLADDWDEFFSSLTPRADGSHKRSDDETIPHAGAVVFGYDFTEAVHAYLEVLSQDRGAVLLSAISSAVLDSILAATSETRMRLHRVLKRIQGMNKASHAYLLSAEQISSAPAIVVLDTVTHYASAAVENLDAEKTVNSRAEKKRKKIDDVENAYVRAALLEDGADIDDGHLLDDDLSDLEDFIVTNPEVDYVEFLHDHFPHGLSDEEEER